MLTPVGRSTEREQADELPVGTRQLPRAVARRAAGRRRRPRRSRRRRDAGDASTQRVPEQMVEAAPVAAHDEHPVGARADRPRRSRGRGRSRPCPRGGAAPRRRLPRTRRGRPRSPSRGHRPAGRTGTPSRFASASPMSAATTNASSGTSIRTRDGPPPQKTIADRTASNSLRRHYPVQVRRVAGAVSRPLSPVPRAPRVPSFEYRRDAPRTVARDDV